MRLKTIQQMLKGGDIFPADNESRLEVEMVVVKIRQHIKKYRQEIWSDEFFLNANNEKICFATELTEYLFNTVDIPSGNRTFYLLNGDNDDSYYDFYWGYPLKRNRVAARYTFTKSQDRYFEYLMAKEGVIRQIREGDFPSEIRWYLL